MIRPAAAELALIATVLLALAARADAQPDAPALDPDLRAAELFDLGIARKRSGDLDGACAAFAESQALDASLGTQLNLAAAAINIGRHEAIPRKLGGGAHPRLAPIVTLDTQVSARQHAPRDPRPHFERGHLNSGPASTAATYGPTVDPSTTCTPKAAKK